MDVNWHGFTTLIERSYDLSIKRVSYACSAETMRPRRNVFLIIRSLVVKQNAELLFKLAVSKI